MRTNNVSSRAALQVINLIPNGEEVKVMGLILDELRKHSNWTQKPNGYAGVFLLARQMEETRTQFKAFFSGVSALSNDVLESSIISSNKYSEV